MVVQAAIAKRLVPESCLSLPPLFPPTEQSFGAPRAPTAARAVGETCFVQACRCFNDVFFHALWLFSPHKPPHNTSPRIRPRTARIG